jgi:hypothetical protein
VSFERITAMKRMIALFLLVAAPAFSLSVEPVKYTSSDGVVFFWGRTGADEIYVAPEDDPEDQYVLRRDCTAVHVKLGTGAWGFAGDGWRIEIGTLSFDFPRQEPPLIYPPKCRL